MDKNKQLESKRKYDQKRAKELKAFTMRLNKELHKEMRLHCLLDDISVTDYITNLIKEDLGWRDE